MEEEEEEEEEKNGYVLKFKDTFRLFQLKNDEDRYMTH